MADKTSPEYAMLPAGTVVMWGAAGAAVSAMKPLINCKALGATVRRAASLTAQRSLIRANSLFLTCRKGLKSH